MYAKPKFIFNTNEAYVERMTAFGLCALCGQTPMVEMRECVRCSNPECSLHKAVIPSTAWKELAAKFNEG